MQLVLVRHAAALDPAPDETDGGNDAARPLSPRGRASFERVVRGLGRLDLRIDLLLHSPLLRAVETAELCVPLLAGATEVTPLLAEPPGEALLERIAAADDEGCVALVGHEPWLSELCGWLLLGWRVHDGPGRAAFRFKKGGIAWLEGDPAPGRFVLRSFLSPHVSTRIRRR